MTHYLGEVENTYNTLCLSVANIFTTMSTEFYQNQPGLADDVTKTFGVIWGFAVPIAVQLQSDHSTHNKSFRGRFLQAR